MPTRPQRFLPLSGRKRKYKRCGYTAHREKHGEITPNVLPREVEGTQGPCGLA